MSDKDKIHVSMDLLGEQNDAARGNLPQEVSNTIAKIPLVWTRVKDWGNNFEAEDAVKSKIDTLKRQGLLLKSIYVQPEWAPDKIVATMVDFNTQKWVLQEREIRAESDKDLKKENEELKQDVKNIQRAHETVNGEKMQLEEENKQLKSQVERLEYERDAGDKLISSLRDWLDRITSVTDEYKYYEDDR